MQFLDFDDQLSSVKTLSKGADSVSKEIQSISAFLHLLKTWMNVFKRKHM